MTSLTPNPEPDSSQPLNLKKDRDWLPIYLAWGVAYALILVVFPHPPLQDYPDHLLEAAVTLHPELFAPWYRVIVLPVPNLLGQALVAILSPAVGILTAGRMVLGFYCLLYALGAYFTSRVFLHRRYECGLVLLVWLPSFFFWRGYVNYSLGIALVLLLAPIGEIVNKRHPRKWPVYDTLAALLLYFTHFFAVAIFFLLRFCRHLVRSPKRALGGEFLAMIPVLLLFLWYRHGLADHDLAWNYGTGLWKVELIKLALMIPYVAPLHSQPVISWINIHNALVVSFWIAAALVTAFSIVRRPILSRSKDALPLVIAGSALLAGYLILPSRVGLIDADMRIFFPLALMVAAGGLHRWSADVQVPRYAISTVVMITILSAWGLTAAQFHSCQSVLEKHAAAASDKESGYEPHPIDQLLMTEGSVPQNAVHDLLLKVKLHTDVTQRALPEAHCRAYYYLSGGRPPHVTEVGVVRKVVP